MISNISNVLPSILKKMKNKDEDLMNLKYDLVETIKFFGSILPNKKGMQCLKHMYLDCVFEFNDDEINYPISSFAITIDTFDFLKDFYYESDEENRKITIRSNYEELAILSLILIGSIKNLKDESDMRNHSIFISLAFHFLSFCINNGYNVCDVSDLKYLEDYNGDFDKIMFKKIYFIPTSEENIGTIHFVGIEFNKDILSIFEKYKNVQFSYNEENASFIITMESKYWDDFWNNAPQYLKDEFVTNSSNKDDIR